jgi:opacity protein-like surface antigen
MRKLLLGSAALAALMSTDTAMPADLVVKAMPPAPPVQYSDWTGVYVGIEGGYGWGNDSFGFGGQNSARVPQDFSTFTAPLVKYVDPTYFTRVYNLPLVISGLNSITTGGFLFGGFIGAQKQTGFWVLGLETDFDGADITGSGSNTVITNASTTAQVFKSTTKSFAGPPPFTTTSTIAITPVINPGAISTTNSMISVDRKIDDLASVRGKFGYTPWQSLMFYGTAGLALAHQATDVSFTQTTTGTMIGVDSKGVFHAAPTIPFSSSVSANASNGAVLFGWAAGGGLDYKLTQNLILGAEYLHYDFGKVGFSLNNSGGVSLAGSGKTTVDALKGRLSWLIN